MPLIAPLAAGLVGALLVAATAFGLHRAFPRNYLRLWAMSWSAAFAGIVAGVALGGTPAGPGGTGWAIAFAVTNCLHAAWLLLGARAFIGADREIGDSRILGAAALLGTASGAASAVLTPRLGLLVQYGLPLGLAGASSIACALAIRKARPAPVVGLRLIEAALALYGLSRLHYVALFVALYLTGTFPDYGRYMGFAHFPILVVLALGIAVTLLEEEHNAVVQRGRDLGSEQERLRASEERYRALVEQSTEGIWRWELDQPLQVDRTEDEQLAHLLEHAHIAECNDVMARLYGLSKAEELQGMRLPALLGLRADPRSRENLRAFVRARYQAVDWEARFEDATGGSRWFQNNLAGIVADGSLLRIWGTQREITERKRSEEEVRRTVSLLQATLESTADGILVVDQRGRTESFNRRFAEMWRIPEEILGSGDDARAIEFVLAQLQSPEEFLAGVKALYAKPDAESFDVLHFKDGRIFERYSQPQRIEGRPVGRVWSFRDVSARRQAEEALRASEERYELAARATSDVIWDWNPTTNRALWSPALTTVFGHPLPGGELSGAWWEAKIHPEERDRVTKAFQTLLDGADQLLTEEYRFQRSDGSYAHVVDQAIVVRDASRKAVRMIGAITDVSARKRAESERERLIADLAAKNAELERFTYTVSHDLKSPLITIRGFLDLLQTSVREGNMERFQADVGRILGASEKMRHLLDDLLELSRIGRVVNPPQDASLRELAREAAELVKGRLTVRGVRVDIAEDAAIRGDRRRLLEVLQNLIDNAAKFMGDQAEPRIEVGARTESARRVVYVRDNGVGIEPRHQEKVFGLFDKLDPKSEGTGVGLALVRRIVEAHGGRVWVESAGKGQGATFCFTLHDDPTA